MLGLFVRMGELFRNKAKSEGLIIYFDENKGVYSETFKLWCVKLKDLTIENFRTGTLGMEEKAEAMYRAKKEMWPPSFAEFRALCFPANDYDKQAHVILPSMFDPNNAHLLEDQTAKEKRRELGKQNTGKLLGLLGVKPPKEITEEDRAHARAALELAKQRLASK